MTSPISIWRNRAQRLNLQGVVCQACGARYYPHKYLCSCGSKIFKPYIFSGRATLVSFTQIMAPPAHLKSEGAYYIGLVQLQEGPRLIAQLASVQLEDLYIGQELVALVRKYSADGHHGIISYGLKFIPKDMA